MSGTNLTLIVAALWAVSEALSLIPAVKSNGIFQLIVNILGSIKGNTPSA